jgi:hypothetical protein
METLSMTYSVRTSKPKQKTPRLLAAATAVALTAAMAACTTATPYQPLSSASRSQGGFGERQIAPDVWQVTFAGNSLTSRDTVEGYLLYRAAELTLQQGNDWFEIVNHDVEHNVTRETYPAYGSGFGYRPWFGYDYWRPYWSYYYPSFGWRSWDPFWNEPFFDTRRIERFQATADIRMHRGAPPAGATQVFDARQVIARLQPTIRLPGDRRY